MLDKIIKVLMIVRILIGIWFMWLLISFFANLWRTRKGEVITIHLNPQMNGDSEEK